MDCQEGSPLFRSPITEKENALDVGTGDGSWALDVAGAFPSRGLLQVTSWWCFEG